MKCPSQMIYNLSLYEVINMFTVIKTDVRDRKVELLASVKVLQFHLLKLHILHINLQPLYMIWSLCALVSSEWTTMLSEALGTWKSWTKNPVSFLLFLEPWFIPRDRAKWTHCANFGKGSCYWRICSPTFMIEFTLVFFVFFLTLDKKHSMSKVNTLSQAVINSPQLCGWKSGLCCPANDVQQQACLSLHVPDFHAWFIIVGYY